MKEQPHVPIYEKYALTISEACEYFGIGEKRLRKLVSQNTNTGFLLFCGTKTLIKRKKFEDFLDDACSI